MVYLVLSAMYKFHNQLFIGIYWVTPIDFVIFYFPCYVLVDGTIFSTDNEIPAAIIFIVFFEVPDFNSIFPW